MTKQEKDFLNAVVKQFFSPVPPGYNRTLTILEAACLVAKEQGEIVPVGDDEQNQFFRTFMGGIMFNDGALQYIEERIQERLSEQEAHEKNTREQNNKMRQSIQEQLKILVNAALTVREMSANCGAVPVAFSPYSEEWVAIKRVSAKFGMTI